VAVPLLMLASYSFVFSTVIPVQLRPDARHTGYAFFLFSGLIAWNLFAETVLPASRIYIDRAHFVRKARFPATALPVSTALAAFYRSLIWLSAFLLLFLLRGTPLGPWILLAPLVLASVAVFSAGVGILAAAAGVVFRDLSELIGPLLTAIFFLSPVLVPAERLAAISPWLVWINPLAPALRVLHEILLAGNAPEPGLFFAGWCWAILGIAVGWIFHTRTQNRLEDLV